MKILQPDDKDIQFTEYDVHLYHRGKKFTGILKDEWEHIEYKDGLIHGQAISFFKLGKVREITCYKNGKELESTKYYDTGAINSILVLEPYSYKVWNIDSILVRENNIFYYNDGNIRKVIGSSKNDLFLIKGYTKNKQLMYTVEKYPRKQLHLEILR